jgi:hypothetical protein
MKIEITFAALRGGSWTGACRQWDGVGQIGDLIRVWGFGRYRKVLEGIGRLKKFRMLVWKARWKTVELNRNVNQRSELRLWLLDGGCVAALSEK